LCRKATQSLVVCLTSALEYWSDLSIWREVVRVLGWR
jgi:hypothetical protein